MLRPEASFTVEEYEGRIARTRAAMAQAGVDLLIVSDPSNMAWLTGYDGWSFYVHQAVIVGPDGPPEWFGRGIDAKGALRTCYMADEAVFGYPDEYVQSTERHPMDLLAERLRGRHGAARIGVEMDNYWFSAAAFAALQRGLPDARFSDATGLVNWQRLVKSDTEIAHMRKAACIVERMHERIRDRAEVGMRKCDLVADIYDASLRYDPASGAGGDYPAIVPLLPSGSDAAACHLTWDDAPLKAGEGTYFEIAGVYRRYHCPLSRTLYLGTPPPHFLAAEQALLDGLDDGIEAARPGNACDHIARAFSAALARHGFEKDSRSGYSIGLSYPPDWGERTLSIRRGDMTELRPNMTIHFMASLWQQDWGIEITETIAITESGAECLAHVPRAITVKD